MSFPRTYVKKPISIKAFQLVPATFQDVIEWVGTENLAGFDREECTVRIKTLEGVMEADENDFVIQGVKGEFYPCKPDIFHLSYTELTFS